MSRIAEAYVQIVPSMTGAKSTLEKELSGALPSSLSKTGAGIGATLMDGLNKVGRAGAVLAGGAIVAGLGASLVKGFQRLDSLDQATAKLTGLGHSAETVEGIMENALASVRGTAFGMDEAASTAAGAVAAGIEPGADLERTLKAVADAATIAGTDMGSMGAIFNKVAASNKVQMDVINQLQDAGVPALALLAEQMGVTAEEASAMASAGEIDFATFQSAMEAGMGGAALASGETFSGAMDNVGAALGRIGASLLGGVFPQMKDGLSGLLEAMAPLEDVAKDVGAAVGEFVTFVGDNISWIGPLATGIAIAVGAIILWTAVQWLLNAALTANPIGIIIVGIGLLIGAIILLVQNWDTVVAWMGDVWNGFVGWLTDGLNAVGSFFTDVWTNISTFFSDVWNGIVQTATDAWNGVVAFFQTGLQAVVTLFLNWTLLGQIIKNWDLIQKVFTDSWNGIVDFFSGAIDSFVRGWESAWSGVGNFIRDTFNNIVGFVKAPLNAIIGLINGVIGSINQLKIDIPDWVPGVGGQTLGFNVPRIPMLADGGVITGSGSVIVGEAGPEMLTLPRGARVDPLSDQSDDRSPSGVLELGQRTMSELADIMLDRLPEVLARRDRVASRMGDV